MGLLDNIYNILGNVKIWKVVTHSECKTYYMHSFTQITRHC